jgi:hypothetical protein
VGSQERFQRISFVCYFREKIEDCIEKETKDYYQKIDFDVVGEVADAKKSPVQTLPIPGVTGTLEEAIEAAKGLKGLKSTKGRRSAKAAKVTKRKSRKAA